jgi:hypothetical protein
MIKDTSVLAELQKSWVGLKQQQGKVTIAVAGSMGMFGGSAIVIANVAHNLPFIQACSVLNEALLQLSKEGHFQCGSFFLGKLMPASRRHLPWQDYDLVDKAVKRRNDVAHRSEILPRGECQKYVDAIERELRAWGIPAP